jgi:hypothetical protein
MMVESAMKLHENHARSLESALNLADAAALRLERLLNERGQQGVVRVIEDTLSAETRSALLGQVRELRRMLAAMVESFSLEPHHMDLRRILDAETSSLWVLLEDCRPSRMKGYGQEFAPGARAALDATIDDLIAHVRRMRARIE